jgi:hyperosmotically inducible periplasmic protein
MRTARALVVAIVLLAGFWGRPDFLWATQQKTTPQLGNRSSRSNAEATRARIGEQVRHELALMPYYGVFDWIEAQVTPDYSVVLRGQVTRPTTKSDAANRVKKLESVSKVVNQIEELPPSPSDDRTRAATYRAIFNYNSPLFRYSTLSRPPIHIVVKNGRVALKGFVNDAMDRQLAYTYARGVPGVFEVRNELQVVKNQ